MKTLLLTILLAMLTACGGGDAPSEPVTPRPAVLNDGLGIPRAPRVGSEPSICTVTNADGSKTTYHCVR